MPKSYGSDDLISLHFTDGQKNGFKGYLDSHQLAMLLRVPNCQIMMLTSYCVQVLLFV